MGPVSEQLWVWGVDVSTKRIAISCHGADQVARMHDYPKDLLTGARLGAIYAETRELAAELAADRPPLFVWVEQPASYGRQVEPALMYAVGVVQAALYAELEQRSAHPTEVRTIPVANWKKVAVGFGNAKKHQVLVWAKKHGFRSEHVCSDRLKWCGHKDHDAADAWAIATAGARLLSQPEQLELAS